MRVRIIYLTIQIITGLCLALCCPVYAEEVPSEDETALLELINQARENPSAMASSLNMDVEKIIKDLPELEDILINGLPPLAFNGHLFTAASLHSQDMIANNYYSHTSPDGRTFDDRILESGYFAAVTGESLGMVGFNNFIEPSEAVQAIFEKMFRRELDASRVEKRNILNPEMTDVGIGLSAGVLDLAGMHLNAYMATCDFGTHVDKSAVEAGLWRMFNAARNSPGQALVAIGVDEEAAAEAFGDQAWVLTTRHPPLAWSPELYEAAAAYCRDMIENECFEGVLPDGQTPYERVVATGYDPVDVGETLALLEFRTGDPLDIARCIYENIFRQEVDIETPGEINVLAPNLTEVGIAVETAVVDSDTGDRQYIYVMVAVFAIPCEQRSFVIGTIYHDGNANGVPDSGEGIPGLEISVRPMFTNADPTDLTETSLFGDYQLRLTSVFTELSVHKDGSVVESTFVGGQGRNVLRDFTLFP